MYTHTCAHNAKGLTELFLIHDIFHSTRFECADKHVESPDYHNGDKSKVPSNDKHDGHTQQSSQ